jgi:hypothetical protein
MSPCGSLRNRSAAEPYGGGLSVRYAAAARSPGFERAPADRSPQLRHPGVQASASACRVRLDRKRPAIMDRKGEAPSMYEMEGASQFRDPKRSDCSVRGSAEPATITWRNLGELRLTRCPPTQGVASPGGSPIRWTLLRTPASEMLALTNSRIPSVRWLGGFPLNRVTISGGVRDFYLRRKARARG